jgi:hypothetical protein
MRTKQSGFKKNKMHRAMGKFKRGTLHSGSGKGPLVRTRKQAVAIGLAEGRRKSR